MYRDGTIDRSREMLNRIHDLEGGLPFKSRATSVEHSFSPTGSSVIHPFKIESVDGTHIRVHRGSWRHNDDICLSPVDSGETYVTITLAAEELSVADNTEIPVWVALKKHATNNTCLTGPGTTLYAAARRNVYYATASLPTPVEDYPLWCRIVGYATIVDGAIFSVRNIVWSKIESDYPTGDFVFDPLPPYNFDTNADWDYPAYCFGGSWWRNGDLLTQATGFEGNHSISIAVGSEYTVYLKFTAGTDVESAHSVDTRSAGTYDWVIDTCATLDEGTGKNRYKPIARFVVGGPEEFQPMIRHVRWLKCGEIRDTWAVADSNTDVTRASGTDRRLNTLARRAGSITHYGEWSLYGADSAELEAQSIAYLDVNSSGTGTLTWAPLDSERASSARTAYSLEIDSNGVAQIRNFLAGTSKTPSGAETSVMIRYIDDSDGNKPQVYYCSRADFLTWLGDLPPAVHAHDSDRHTFQEGDVDAPRYHIGAPGQDGTHNKLTDIQAQTCQDDHRGGRTALAGAETPYLHCLAGPVRNAMGAYSCIGAADGTKSVDPANRYLCAGDTADEVAVQWGSYQLTKTQQAQLDWNTKQLLSGDWQCKDGDFIVGNSGATRRFAVKDAAGTQHNGKTHAPGGTPKKIILTDEDGTAVECYLRGGILCED